MERKFLSLKSLLLVGCEGIENPSQCIDCQCSLLLINRWQNTNPSSCRCG